MSSSLSSPYNFIGKIVKSLEKYFDAQEGTIKVKSRPVLIIGFERNYNSIRDIDFELLPFTTLNNQTPDMTYDYYIGDKLCVKLGLSHPCYLRTHKVSWNHVKHMDIISPIGDMLKVDPELFNEIIRLNKQWVAERIENIMQFTQVEKSG